QAGSQVQLSFDICERADSRQIGAAVGESDGAQGAGIERDGTDSLHDARTLGRQRAALDGGADIDRAPVAGYDGAVLIVNSRRGREVQGATARGFERTGVGDRGAGTLNRERVAARVRVDGPGVVQGKVFVRGVVGANDTPSLDQAVAGEGVFVAVGADLPIGHGDRRGPGHHDGCVVDQLQGPTQGQSAAGNGSKVQHALDVGYCAAPRRPCSVGAAIGESDRAQVEGIKGHTTNGSLHDTASGGAQCSANDVAAQVDCAASAGG